MSEKEHFPPGYGGLFFGEEDLPENQQKLKSFLNEMYWRIKTSDQKVILIFEVLEEVNKIRAKLLSALEPLEVSLLIDAMRKNIDNIAEVVSDLTRKTRTYRGGLKKHIPSSFKNLFVKDKKKLQEKGEKFSKDYKEAKHFLFPDLDRESDNLEKEDFEKLADRILKKCELIIDYRDRVSVHLFDNKRHRIFVKKKEYIDLVCYFLKVLKSLSIVGTYSEIALSLKHSDEEILRVKKGLFGLIRSQRFKKSLLFKDKGIWSKLCQFWQSRVLRK